MYNVNEPPTIKDSTNISSEPYFFYLVPLVFLAIAVTANVTLNLTLNLQTSHNYNIVT